MGCHKSVALGTPCQTTPLIFNTSSLNSSLHWAVRLSQNRPNFELSAVVCLRVSSAQSQEIFGSIPAFSLNYTSTSGYHICTSSSEKSFPVPLKMIESFKCGLVGWKQFCNVHCHFSRPLPGCEIQVFSLCWLVLSSKRWYVRLVLKAKHSIDIQPIFKHKTSSLCVKGKCWLMFEWVSQVLMHVIASEVP